MSKMKINPILLRQNLPNIDTFKFVNFHNFLVLYTSLSNFSKLPMRIYTDFIDLYNGLLKLSVISIFQELNIIFNLLYSIR